MFSPLRLAAALLLTLVICSPARAASTADPIIDSVQNYLNRLTSLRADFLQVAPDGSVSEGTVVLARPGGRIRLDYAPPSRLKLIGSDGWITVRDEAADEDSRWPLSGTPLEALIADQVDLRTHVRVRQTVQAGGIMRITIESKDSPESGTLTLVFSESPLELRQWQVVDSQRLLTTVTLSNVILNGPVEMGLFDVDDPELWSDEDD